MRAAIYARNSKPQRGEKAVPGYSGSWELQVAKCRRAAEAAGDDVVMERFDLATGRNPHRPGWGELMAAVRGRHVQRVYATKMDRPMRNLRHFLDVAADFEKTGCELVFIDQPAASIIKSDPAGKAFRNTLAVFAEFELDLIRERSLDVLEVREDGRTYGPRSEKPAGRPREYGPEHRFRIRNGSLTHDRPNCMTCKAGETGGQTVPLSDPPQNGGLAYPVGFATPSGAGGAQS